jgi:DNA-binding response OmpR family regulator
MKRNILVVEQDPVLGGMFRSAFLHSGYDVKVTDRIAEAAMMISGRQSSRAFDLVIMDMSDRRLLGLVADEWNIEIKIPVFTLRDAADKARLINLLIQKRVTVLEHFMEAQGQAL